MFLNKMRTGIATLLTVFLVSVIAVFMITAWQARLLLSVHRNRTDSDFIAASYNAQSEVNDTVAKFLGGYPNAFTYPFSVVNKVLPDGTILNITGEKDTTTGIETITISTKREYASSRIVISKGGETSEEVQVKDSQILFALDCTGSMGAAACSDPSCSEIQPDTWPKITRMDKMKEAVDAFLEKLGETPGNEKVKVGISLYNLIGNWLYTQYQPDGTPIGNPINPDNTWTIEEMRLAVKNGFGRSGGQESPACKNVLSWTNVGGGLDFMHKYFNNNNPPGIKQIEIIITDGIPNERTPNPKCGQYIFCPVEGAFCCPSGTKCNMTKPLSDDGQGWTCPQGSGENTCEKHGMEYLACNLADTNTAWIPLTFTQSPNPKGVRDPEVDLYSVTVLDKVPFPYVVNSFQDFSTKYYNSNEAKNLPEILNDIFNTIMTSILTIEIKRVVPTP
ncbi:MAG: hypothetical protein UY28_C0020G0006 [Candidatus Amesbacteria bacterium GW2011_GWB1_48_13]|uniref:VWFA domain-containing protein n=2 Tax=Candidatus Amesiibacteriota TaxID=1752730 RepID=A0A0G1UTD2_9BACT|nr:MAG: hypothetical protein UY28_C0020G0006 [Candidatus Amesbacteria bacterium GW2011_GWB1_48_13]